MRLAELLAGIVGVYSVILAALIRRVVVYAERIARLEQRVDDLTPQPFRRRP
jgi:hypothetical protein